MPEFSQEEGFSKVEAKWPVGKIKGWKIRARAKFNQHIKTAEDLKMLLRAVDYYQGLVKKKPYNLEDFIGGDTWNHYYIDDSVAVKPVDDGTEITLDFTPEKTEPTSNQAPVYTPQKTVPLEGWEVDLIASWPANLKGEQEDRKTRAWNEAVTRWPKDEVRMACEHYVECFKNPKFAMIHPFHLSKFLSSKDDGALWREWHERAASMPQPTDIAAFDMVRSWYPQFENDGTSDVELLEMYTRFVPPDDRLDFLISCREYRDHCDRGMKEVPMEFRKTFKTWIKCWRGKPRGIRIITDHVGYWLVRFLKGKRQSKVDAKPLTKVPAGLVPQFLRWNLDRKPETTTKELIHLALTVRAPAVEGQPDAARFGVDYTEDEIRGWEAEVYEPAYREIMRPYRSPAVPRPSFKDDALPGEPDWVQNEGDRELFRDGYERVDGRTIVHRDPVKRAAAQAEQDEAAAKSRAAVLEHERAWREKNVPPFERTLGTIDVELPEGWSL